MEQQVAREPETRAVRLIKLREKGGRLLRKVLRPGSRIAASATAATATLGAMRTFGWPERGWEGFSLLNIGLVGSAVPAALGTAVVAYGYPRALRRAEQDGRLLSDCLAMANVAADELTRLRKAEMYALAEAGAISQEEADAEPGVRPRDLAVHIWELRGWPKPLRHLTRRVEWRPHGGKQSIVVWRPGKGVLGICCDLEEPLVADVADVARRAETREDFDRLPKADQFNLTWSEFNQIRSYCAVLTVPLHDVLEPHDLQGVVSVGLLVDGFVEHLRELPGTTRFSVAYNEIEHALVGVMPKIASVH